MYPGPRVCYKNIGIPLEDVSAKTEYSENFQKGAPRICQGPRNTNPSTKQFPDFGFMPKNGENGEKVDLA